MSAKDKLLSLDYTKQIPLITGNLGIGKTNLVEELALNKGYKLLRHISAEKRSIWCVGADQVGDPSTNKTIVYVENIDRNWGFTIEIIRDYLSSDLKGKDILLIFSTVSCKEYDTPPESFTLGILQRLIPAYEIVAIKCGP